MTRDVNSAEARPQSSGVQELIERLRQEGVEQGRGEAEKIVADARRRAAEMVDSARHEAEEILASARQESRQVQDAGLKALRLATRDAVLALKAEILERFSARLRVQVFRRLDDEEFLKRLVLRIAGQAAEHAGRQPIELVLPERLPTGNGRSNQEAEESLLDRFAAALAGDTLREGVRLAAGDNEAAGLTLRLVEDDVEIDLTDKAVADLLLRYLLPRFRAILEGVANDLDAETEQPLLRAGR